MRGIGFAHNYAHLLDSHREELGAELIANTEAGMQLGLDDYLEARDQRTRIYGRMAALFERIDVLAAPVVTVLPFPAEQRWPSEINGVPQQDYLEWMRASWRITVTGFTAISVPCGFSPEGLPVGIQLIAPPRHEARLLALAAQFERARPAWRETPRILTSPTPTLSPSKKRRRFDEHPCWRDPVCPPTHQGVHHPEGTNFVALDGVNLDIRPGEFFVLLGPSGCGKTTLLRSIAGLEQPTEGEIWLGENRIDQLPPYRRRVNTVFQAYALFPISPCARTSLSASRWRGRKRSRQKLWRVWMRCSPSSG